MNGIGSYLISVLAAAMICALVNRFWEKKDSISMVIRLLAGVFLMIVVLQPILHFSISDIPMNIDYLSAEAADIIEEGQLYSKETVQNLVKTQTEEYILQEAEKRNMQITVELRFDDTDPLKPESVIITGTSTPYAKSYLAQFLVDNVGIAKENQLWIG